ncbi:MAG: ABC transporter ATP-binding protein [Eubacterium sp.]
MIEIKNLTIQFNGQAPVVDNMTLTIPDGCRMVILGESGSGKSVTLAAILGILPPEARLRGSIKIDGLELLNLNECEMRRIRGKVIGYIPQGSGNGMNPLMSVGEQISEPLIQHDGLDKREAFQKAKEWMEKLGLTPADRLAQAYPHTLSGGMRQRALMAMGIAGGAEILLADEPTKGLDEKRIAEIEKMFIALKTRTILCVSHDLRFTHKIADAVCVMYSGKTVEIADAKIFFSNPGHPYSKMMIEALPENGLKCPGGYAPPLEDRFGCSFANRCPKAFEQCVMAPEMISVKKHQVRCHLYGT